MIPQRIGTSFIASPSQQKGMRFFSGMGNQTRSYQDFFALWKNADPGIAILDQAKTEYSKLE